MSHVLFNRSYIAQALWVEPEEIKEIRILNRKAAEVTLSIDGKKHKTIVKDKEVKRYLIAARKERAKNIEIQEVDPAILSPRIPSKVLNTVYMNFSTSFNANVRTGKI